MKNYTVKKYESQDYAIWNAFISEAKNATFLFHRDYMEYHSDRFEDFSLLVFDDKKLISVLPANRKLDTLYSHQGLTYGGFVLNAKIRLGDVLLIAKSVLEFLHLNAISSFQLKLIPSIYNHFFSEEIEYALFLANAKLIRRDCLSVIDLNNNAQVSRLRNRGLEKAKNNNLILKEDDDFDSFWNKILIPNLQKKHNVKPVHTLEEILYLKNKFPNNIRQFNVYHNLEIVAGVTIFITEKVAHPQYISGTVKDNELGSLDFLYSNLIKNVFKEKDFFDFGHSHEENGMKINEGLLFWKESFGAKTTVQDFYEVETQNFILLEAVFC